MGRSPPNRRRLTPDLLELVRFLKAQDLLHLVRGRPEAVIPYGAQYRGGARRRSSPVMQNRLSRTTERLYTLAGELPAKPKPGPRQQAAVEALRSQARSRPASWTNGGHLQAHAGYPVCRKGVLTGGPAGSKALDLFAEHSLCTRSPSTLAPEQQQALEALAAGSGR